MPQGNNNNLPDAWSLGLGNMTGLPSDAFIGLGSSPGDRRTGSGSATSVGQRFGSFGEFAATPGIEWMRSNAGGALYQDPQGSGSWLSPPPMSDALNWWYNDDSYQAYSELSREPLLTAGAIRSIEQNFRNFTASQEGNEAALGTIGDLIREMQGFLGEVEGDPIRQQVMADLTRRMSPDYYVLGPEQRMAMEGQLAAGLNRSRQQGRAALTGAGWGDSGIARGLDPMLSAIGTRGLGQISAQLGIANEAAQGQAGLNLNEVNINWGKFEKGIRDEIDRLGTIQSAFERDPTLTNFDNYELPNLQHTRDAYRTGVNQFNAALEAGQDDWWLDALGLIGTGIYEPALDFLGLGNDDDSSAFEDFGWLRP